MDKVFIYWDNSNIFIGAQKSALAREGYLARYQVRIHFQAMLRLAQAGRPLEKAIIAGSVPPGARELWDKLRGYGVKVEELFDRGSGKEQEVPDERLQLQMMRDALTRGLPGVAVLLTGDGKGREQGKGFHHTLELMHAKGWRTELLAWDRDCKPEMRDWARKNGVYVPLDSHYKSVTYLKESVTAPGRKAERVDFSGHPTASR